MTDLMVIEQQGLRVLTTAQLAECYGTDSKIISQNFKRNADRYEEGKHYICLKGEDLRAFRANPQIEDLPKNLNVLYLWTERGALLHAKSLNTDKAWEVYGELVETYFRAKKAETALQNLSPQLQLMIKFETEQNALKSRVTELERRVEDMTAPEPGPERLPFTDEPKRWSEREIEYLRRAYSLGQTDVEIAAELGRTLGSIKSKRWVLGLGAETNERTRWTKMDDKRLKQYLDEGYSTREIAAKMRRSVQGIQSRKKRLGLSK